MSFINQQIYKIYLTQKSIKMFMLSKSDKKIDLNKPLNSDLRINDIDLPLYRYGLIHQIDINNYFNDNEKLKLQKIKYCLIIIWMVLYIIREILCLYYIKKMEVFPNICLTSLDLLEIKNDTHDTHFSHDLSITNGKALFFNINLIFLY